MDKKLIEACGKIVDAAIVMALIERNNYSTGVVYGSKERFEQLKKESNKNG